MEVDSDGNEIEMTVGCKSVREMEKAAMTCSDSMFGACAKLAEDALERDLKGVWTINRPWSEFVEGKQLAGVMEDYRTRLRDHREKLSQASTGSRKRQVTNMTDFTILD